MSARAWKWPAYRGPDAGRIERRYIEAMSDAGRVASTDALGLTPDPCDYGAPAEVPAAWYQPGAEKDAYEAARAAYAEARKAWDASPRHAEWEAACQRAQERGRQFSFGVKGERVGGRAWWVDVGTADAYLANALAWAGEPGQAPTVRAKVAGKARARKPADVAPVKRIDTETAGARLRRVRREINALTIEYHAAILAAAEADGVSSAARDAGWTRQGVYALQRREAAAA